MRLTRVFSEQRLELGIEFTLDSEISQHLLKVMRLRPGQEFTAFDNSGAEFLCSFKGSIQAKRGQLQARAEVVQKRFPQVELPGSLRVFCAIVKGERFDWLVEKLTELGVSEIVPLQTEFTQVFGPADNKQERWQRLAIKASCQSGRVRVPKVSQPCGFVEAVRDCSGRSEGSERAVSGREYSANFERSGIVEATGQVPCQVANFLFTAQAQSWPELAVYEYVGCKTSNIFIGPEGGFSSQELELAREQNFKLASLGRRILRVETAALAAAVLVINSCWNS